MKNLNKSLRYFINNQGKTILFYFYQNIWIKRSTKKNRSSKMTKMENS